MMQAQRIFVLAVGDRQRASSRLRVWDHVDWLRSRPGVELVADHVVPGGVTRTDLRLLLRLAGKLPRWAWHCVRADVVYIQESLLLAPLLWLRRALGRRSCFDFSDPVDLAGGRRLRPLRQAAFRCIVRSADHVMVENRAYQAEFASAGIQARHFYGPVNVRRYREAAAKVVRQPGVVHVGWTGSPSTLHFIAHLFPVLDELARTRPLRLTLMGVERVDYAFQHLAVSAMGWSEAREFDVVPAFDLGLFCLEETEEALRRGAGKLFIYMAAGVAFVADARGIARDVMAESQAGFAVARRSDWAGRIAAAVEDAAARGHAAQQGQQFALAALSYEAYRVQLAELLAPEGVSWDC